VLFRSLPLTFTMNKVTLKIKATDAKYPVTSVMVKVNGRPIAGSSDLGIAVTGKGNDVSQSYQVPLVSGANVISAAAYNEMGIRSDFKELRVTYQQKTSGRSLYLLALAVDTYSKSATPAKWKLDKPVSDAKALEAAFLAQKGKLYNDVKTRLLLNKDATDANFKTAIYEFIKSQAQPEDVVVIYLAGHGVIFDRKYYFVTGDADPEKPFNGLNWNNFEDAMENDLDYISKVVVINDTCKSGALTRGAAADDSELFRHLSEAFGVFNLSATTSTEDSLDGVFTGVLTDGLKGNADANKDGVVMLDELVQYVRTMVTKVSVGRMHPQLKNITEGMDFPIALVK
jgi:hypothetical protein